MPADTTMTLAIELAALRRLADPGDVVSTARRWSENVLVVTNRPPHVQTKFEREFGVQSDFEPEPTSGRTTLEHARTHLDTDRHVHVSVGRVETPDGWELLPLEEAADDAGWTLVESEPRARGTRVDTSTDDWP